MAKRSRCGPCFALIKLHLFSDCATMPPTPAEYDSCTSRSCLTTPLPELLMVAEKLPEVLPRVETIIQEEILVKSQMSSPKTPRAEKNSDLIYKISEERISTTSFRFSSEQYDVKETKETIFQRENFKIKNILIFLK